MASLRVTAFGQATGMVQHQMQTEPATAILLKTEDKQLVARLSEEKADLEGEIEGLER